MSDALVNGLAGACGGIFAQTLTYPLQAVNTRQQVRRKLLASAESESNGEQASQQPEDGKEAFTEPASTGPSLNASPATAAAPTGSGAGQKGSSSSGSSSSAGVAATAREMWQIVREEGVGGLYRGLEPALVGTACSQGVYYYFYQMFRDQAELMAQRRQAKGQGQGQVTMVESLIVAAIAGCLNVMLTNPIWVIVTRMQTQSKATVVSVITATKEQRNGVSDAQLDGSGPGGEAEPRVLTKGQREWKHSTSVKQVPPSRPMGALATVWELFEEAGVLGFWKGVLPTLIMVSNPAIQYTIYETLLARITRSRPRAKGGAKSASAWEIFLIGAVAKLGATVVTYPLLVVKSRLQARQTDPSSKYSGTLNALVRIVMEEGITGLYKGMETKIVQSVFAASVLFLTKEEIVKLVRSIVERREKVSLSRTSSKNSLKSSQ